MIKLYKYPHAPPHLHDRIAGYENSVPFSEAGIAKHCRLVGPEEAELFYCGQYDDNQHGLLEPERFEFFRGRENKHVFDIEGDMGMVLSVPDSKIYRAVFSAMNALPDHRNMNVFVRPGCSMLLKDMVANPRVNLPEPNRGFYFCGQRDVIGTRAKVQEAFINSKLPGRFVFTDQWHCPTPPSHPAVRQYEEGMKEWKFALCPAGWGQSTQRYYEAVMLGRTPVVIADNLGFEDDLAHPLRISSSASVGQMTRWFKAIYDNGGIQEYIRVDIAELIRAYFADPTLYFINWMKIRGLI